MRKASDSESRSAALIDTFEQSEHLDTARVFALRRGKLHPRAVKGNL